MTEKEKAPPTHTGTKGNLGFIIGAVVAGSLILPHIYYSACLYKEAQAFDPSYPWPQITELWKALVSGVFFLTAKAWVVKSTMSYHMGCVKNVGKEDIEMTKKRAHKMGKYTFSFFYFMFATTYGYITTKDERWMPWFLGGTAQDFSLM